MRVPLTGMVGLCLVAMSACGGSTGATTSSTGITGGNTSGGVSGSSSGGSTGSASTGSSTTGGPTNLAPGAPCSADGQCQTGICGINGSGNCCSATCDTSDATCGATQCDDTGACTYPASTACGAGSCVAGMLTTSACNGAGTCLAGSATACPGSLQCAADAMSCLSTCTVAGDCLGGFWCSAGACTAILPNGSACSENDACQSTLCGTTGSGHCCAAACDTSDPTCGATDCDSTGACTFPASTTACGTGSCAGNTLTASTCDGTGACVPDAPAPCANHLTCSDATSCFATCTASSDCVAGYWCSGGSCISQRATGPCTSNDTCTSGICGANGSGHCCAGPAACNTANPTCGATDCDDTSGACVYPSARITCGASSCNMGIQIDSPLCDGLGTCQLALTTPCTPFLCGPTACLISCSDNSSCGQGDFCDIGGSACCDAIGATLTVDSVTGNDAACCGIGTNAPCQTLTKAMALIGNAATLNVQINATVNAGGGDWAPAGETYPITLGWGVELSAPGVFFNDTNAHTEIFDVSVLTVVTDYASIVGTGGAALINVGMNAANDQQTNDNDAVVVERGATLYLANASVNGSSTNGVVAIDVRPGGSLTLGQDQLLEVTGTVYIGNSLGQHATDGNQGIFCETDGVSLGGEVTDAQLVGQSSVVIQGQEGPDINAQDYCNISLTSSPIIGIPPTAVGFTNSANGTGCSQKLDNFHGVAAIFANGFVDMTFDSATIQCITGHAFLLQASGLGAPTVHIDSSLIQNTDLGIYASAGTATVSNTTLNFNYIATQQDTDGINNGTIDLTGNGVGGNTVVCSSNQESSSGSTNPGIDVYNTSTINLPADGVAWDASGPDYFDCDAAFTSCTCNLTTCTITAGADGMDAVEDSTNLGGVTTTHNTLSATVCN